MKLVRDIESFHKTLQMREYQARPPVLYAFLLFDDRPSHAPIAKFAAEQFNWLDQLASSNRMYFFVYHKSESSESRNPSLEVAQKFNLYPNQLPGIILFTAFDDDRQNEGIYLPLKASLFDEAPQFIEERFSDLFSLIQECERETQDQAELLGALGRKISRLRREDQLRPLKNYVEDALMIVVSSPKSLLSALVAAFGTQAVVRIFGS